ncbi:MAG: M15 family metallopeptidase [Cyclobacteriaceae bacterium]
MKDRFLAVLLSHILLTSFSVSAQSDAASVSGKYIENLFDKSILFDTTRVTAAETAVVTADSVIEWKQWRTVDNFYYGKNRGALPMIADLQALHPYFRDRIVELIRVCNEAGITVAIVESYRTPAKQAEYYAMGKKYTSTPGGKSRHQYGIAVDVVPVVDSVAVWDNHKLWKKIGLAGERLGLQWGGRWRVLYDPGHFEWSGGLSRHQLAKGHLPRIPGSLSERYPTLSEEVKQLQLYWNAWEVEQSMMASNGTAKAGDEVAGVGN